MNTGIEKGTPIDWRPLWGPPVETREDPAVWIRAFAGVSAVPGDVTFANPDLTSSWSGAMVGSVEVVKCHAVDTNTWYGGSRTMLAARYPVSLGLGLRAAGWLSSDFVAGPAADDAGARRFFSEPSAVARWGILAVLVAAAHGRFVILTDTQIYLEPDPAHDVDDVARFLAGYAENVAARKREIGSPAEQRERAAGLAEALAAHEASVDPRHDSVVVRRGDFVVEAVHYPDVWDPYTHVRLVFPVALGPPFVVRRASGLVPQIFASDTAIGDSELDRKLEMSTNDPAALASVLRGPLREPILALRDHHPTFTFTERALDVATRGAFSVAGTATLVEQLLAIAATLSTQEAARPYR